MANLCSSQNCTSCMACYNACPFNAISFVESPLSNLIPNIDNNKCRECGLCEKSCHILTNPLLNKPTETIALYTKDEKDRKSCSSGGLVTTLGRHIISKGGVVYGATSIGGTPKYIRVSDNEMLEHLKGSKYVYCNPESIFQEVKKDLKLGKICLFIGLPCIVAGLIQYLGKKYDNLLTIDLVCHGAPPSKYLIEYLEKKIPQNKKINNITFRGQVDYQTSIYDSTNNLIYSKNQFEDEYFVAFMQGITYRPVCYQCNYAKPERVSDITAGDFWGIGKDALNGYRGKISLALLNTTPGKKLFEETKNKFIWEPRPLDEAVKGNPQLRQPTQLSTPAKIFQRHYISTKSLHKSFFKSGVIKITTTNKIRRILLYIPKTVLRIIRKHM